MKPPILTTCGFGNPRFVAGFQRLESEWFPDNPTGVAGCPWPEDLLEGVPTDHYRFKPKLLAETAQRYPGHIVCWVDSSIRIDYARLPVIWEIIGQRGALLFGDPDHVQGRWASDESLYLLGVTRDEMMNVQALSACVVGVDTARPECRRFLTLWAALADQRLTFAGPHSNLAAQLQCRARGVPYDPRNAGECGPEECWGHRHDQTVAGILQYVLELPTTQWVENGVQLLAYPPKTGIFTNKG